MLIEAIQGRGRAAGATLLVGERGWGKKKDGPIRVSGQKAEQMMQTQERWCIWWWQAKRDLFQCLSEIRMKE